MDSIIETKASDGRVLRLKIESWRVLAEGDGHIVMECCDK